MFLLFLSRLTVFSGKNMVESAEEGLDISASHMIDEIPTGHSQIQDFYAGATIFLTGATGFLGKLLLEKLLRTCSSVRKIYILVRPKKGKDISSRVQEIFESQVNRWDWAFSFVLFECFAVFRDFAAAVCDVWGEGGGDCRRHLAAGGWYKQGEQANADSGGGCCPALRSYRALWRSIKAVYWVECARNQRSTGDGKTNETA